jgi:hypothetical protein
MKRLMTLLPVSVLLLLNSCSKSSGNSNGSLSFHLEYMSTDSGSVAYAISKSATDDRVDDVTYTLNGSLKDVNGPSQPYFWESPVLPNQDLLFSGQGESSTRDLYARITVYNSKGIQVYTDTASFK